LGASLGPAIAGVLIDLGGYNAIAIFIAVAMTVAIALAVKVNHGLTTPAREQG
jgi:uncharacterized membrane protein YgaE (UPF0421/DUF939 family)